MMQKQPETSSRRVIRASEIGQYKYCARAWWLGVIMGVPSANIRELAQGEATHQRHGQAVWAAGALRAVALVLMLAGILILIFALLR